MRPYLMLVIAAALLFLSGCTSNSTITLSDQAAYLKFTGNYAGASAKLDTGTEFLINPENKKNLLYQYPAGIHVLSLFRNGTLIYKKNVVLENGKITEVLVP
jgi:hypothetical protein